MSDYEFVAKSSLKLKSTDGMVVKAKKKKNKSKAQKKQFKQMVEKSANDQEIQYHSDCDNDPKTSAEGSDQRWMTSAEKKFLEQQRMRQTTRIMAKASKSHKQRVEEFNQHLENLTEHYDIPKVSWTK